jgi:hypothetical protein
MAVVNITRCRKYFEIFLDDQLLVPSMISLVHYILSTIFEQASLHHILKRLGWNIAQLGGINHPVGCAFVVTP